MLVHVRENNVDKALKLLKRKLQSEGVFKEMRLRERFEKPSEQRARLRAEAVKRRKKRERKAMQDEGLLPKPKRRQAAERQAVSRA